MADWDDIIHTVETHIATVVEQEERFKEDVKQRIETAKRDEILEAVRMVNRRLDAIEKRLPPEDGDDEAASRPKVR